MEDSGPAGAHLYGAMPGAPCPYIALPRPYPPAPMLYPAGLPYPMLPPPKPPPPPRLYPPASGTNTISVSTCEQDSRRDLVALGSGQRESADVLR
eukprot:800847-Prorocentrum_minimum.AAC.9